MLHPKELLFIFLLLIYFYPASGNYCSYITNGNDTLANGLTRDESILFNMINDLRIKNKLLSIPLSRDLCVVAKTHIEDLIKWNPQERGCSLHSWSGSGKWTSCCNTKDLPGIQCMKSKPREITGYRGDGYELIYWDEENATPAEAAALWQDVEASANMILNRAKWTNYQWNALGLGIKGGYAVLWLGDTIGNNTVDNKAENRRVITQPVTKDNSASKPKTTEIKPDLTETEVKQKGITAGKEVKFGGVNDYATKYYLIVSSFKTVEAAEADLKNIRINGYPSAFILEGESNFRIAVSSHDSYEKATTEKNKLKGTFPGVWIFKKGGDQ